MEIVLLNLVAAKCTAHKIYFMVPEGKQYASGGQRIVL
jgi:hypothetical protein